MGPSPKAAANIFLQISLDKRIGFGYNRSCSKSTYGQLAQLVEHPLDVRRVSGSSPLLSTTKETSFVYQDKRGFFMLLGAKYGKNK